MTKQETSTRAVTKSDLTVVGEAIDLTYPLYSRLIQIKVVLNEIGALEQRYRDIQRSIENLEAAEAEQAKQFEATRTEFAREQKAREDQITKLDIVIKDQREEVARLNDSIKRLMANLQAA
jgi:predicted RNase H-like nuclease (RuvC/YqgF family)